MSHGTLWWIPPEVEQEHQLAIAKLAQAKQKLREAYASAQVLGTGNPIGYWREQVETWQATVDVLMLGKR